MCVNTTCKRCCRSDTDWRLPYALDLPRPDVGNLERGDAVIGQEVPEGLRDQQSRPTQPRVLRPICHCSPPLEPLEPLYTQA